MTIRQQTATNACIWRQGVRFYRRGDQAEGKKHMRWGIVTAAVIAVARSLWSLIVDRTISKHRGRPMRTRTVFSLALSLLPFAGGEAFAAERRVALVIGNSSYIHAPGLDNGVGLIAFGRRSCGG